MIFDDHDVNDDWNTSETWVRQMRDEPWWEERIVGAFMSYWIYQHLGNLSPEELERDGLFRQVQRAKDPSRILREFAYRADREVGASLPPRLRQGSPHRHGLQSWTGAARGGSLHDRRR